MNKPFRINWQTGAFLAAVAGSLLFVNLISLRWFGRFDSTPTGTYTLSQSSKDVLAKLEEPVAVFAYFSADLPPPYSGNSRYVRDMLEEYRAASKNKVGFEFVDPAAVDAKSDEKREVKRDVFGRVYREPSAIEREITSTGVQPVEIRVMDSDQAQTRRVWMGLVVKYQGKREVLPVVKTLDGLEYELTSMILRLSQVRKPVIGALTGHGEVGADKTQTLWAELARGYDVREATIGDKATVDAAFDALFVIGPTSALSPAEVGAVEKYLATGKSVALFLDAYRADLESLRATPAKHGFDDMLKKWGVSLGKELVLDVSAATISMSERRGAYLMQTPVKYPLVPMVSALESDSPIGQGLGDAVFPFVVPLTLTPATDVLALVAAKSSTRSWLDRTPPNVDPRRDWSLEAPTFGGPYSLMASLVSQGGKGGRIVVAGTSALAQDQFIAESAGNQALLLNVADWLMLDASLVSLRSRGVATATLRQDLSPGLRSAVKWGNAVGLPLLLIAFGLIRLRMKEARRSSVRV